ncbi:hypothetical protein HOG98_04850 [bacterium]|jgi:Spy/CpxP family protein refolding chaperone|nr:hypothetical protein [bacterium]
MFKIKNYFLLILLLLTMQNTYASERSSRHKQKHQQPNWIKNLDLDKKQIKFIKTRRTYEKEKIRKIRGSIKSYKKDLRVELAKPNADDKKINSIMTEISVLKKSALKSRVNSIKNLKKILKPEQKKKMKKHLILYKETYGSND